MTETDKLYRIMLVDDHPVVRHGMRGALEDSRHFVIVGEAENADDAVSAVEMLNPDIVLLDIRIKGGRSGIDVANELKQRRPDVKIVTLTNHAQEPYLRAMVAAGVDGYLLKDTPPTEIVKAISKVARGENVFSDVLGEVTPNAFIGCEANGDLLSTEAEILQMIADGATNHVIAEQLTLDHKTVQMHLARAFAKLGVPDREAAVKKAAEDGYIVVDDVSA